MKQGLIVLIDDLRSFKDAQMMENAVVIRTIKDALTWLDASSGVHVAQLWLDHDLGEVDGVATDVMPFVNLLEERLALGEDAPYVDDVIVHTSNSVGRSRIIAALSGRVGRVVAVDAGAYFTAQ